MTRRAFAYLAILVLAACGGDASAPEPELPVTIDVQPQSMTLSVGESQPIQAMLTNAKSPAISYSSLNASVATVSSSGMVTAVGPGSTSINVSAVAHPGVGSIVSVTVRQLPGNLEITAQDQFGGALSSARVDISGINGFSVTGTTNSSGVYRRDGLNAGSYTVTVSKSGFIGATQNATVGGGQTSRSTVRLQPESRPSAAVVGITSRGRAGNSYMFDIDLVVVDANARPLTLPASNFVIEPFTSGGTTQTFVQTGFTTRTTASQGPYSAALLLDQSGSITTTDPNHSRLQAAKIFLNALGTGETAALSAFASNGSIPFELTLYQNGNFVTNGSTFFSTLDQLASQVGGGTPLYKSIYSMIDHTATRAPAQNKAVVVFTDGDDTGGGVTIDQIAARAMQTGVKVFTVALGQINTGVLSDIATRTGGSFMWAGDARQLVSIYGTLGNLLRGNVSAVRTSWTMTTSSTNLASIWTSVRINTGTTTVYAPFKVNF